MLKKFSVRSKFRKYNVSFVGDFTQELARCVQDPAIVIVDKKVYELFRDRLSFLKPEMLIIVESREDNKTIDFCQRLIRQMIDKKIKKNYKLIAVGGGVVQDITAFMASILFRGIEWIFFPTTLLAQADSCIGSKTSINFEGYKNILGNFYPPSLVYIDMSFLNSLAEEETKSGIGEMLHFFLYAGNSCTKKMIKEYDLILKERKRLKKYIAESLQIKKRVIEVDEFDKGERNLFNYGHTFGHALESITNYAIPHGQAVTVGMDLANYLSLKKKLISEEQFQGMHQILLKNMPTRICRFFSLKKYMKVLSKDKKNVNSNLTCILTHGQGRMEKREILMDGQLQSSIKEYFDCFKFCGRK